MKRCLLVMISMLFLQNGYSQHTTFFNLEPKHTQRKLKEYDQSPVVYKVAEKEFKFIAAASKKRVENKEFKELELEITALENDSIQREEQYKIKLSKFSQVSKIKVLINDFISSTKPYELKKEKLVTAQKIANTHGIDELIYADNSINSNLKSKFFVLQLNKLDLKVHLKKVTWRLDKMDLVKPVRKPSALINQRLKDLRARKRNVRQYKYIASKPKTIMKKGLVTMNEFSPSVIEGQFVNLGTYYIVKNDYKHIFKKGQLLDGEVARKYKLASQGFVGAKQLLMQDTRTKEKFVTNSDFLNRYAFSINGKFNSKASEDKLNSGATKTAYAVYVK